MFRYGITLILDVLLGGLFAILQHNIQVLIGYWVADINLRHIRWINDYLPNCVTAFQNHSIPVLPIEDASIDLISAYSVFSHLEAFDLTWLMELKRILRPGGILYVSVHSDHTWISMNKSWPVFKALKNHSGFDESIIGKPMNKSRYIFRSKNNNSYSTNVFLTTEYIKKNWGRLFDIIKIRRQHPGYQDAVIMQNNI